jgi:hypothetical protein
MNDSLEIGCDVKSSSDLLLKNSPKQKINILRKIMYDCKEKVEIYKKKYRKLKKIDDVIDVFTSFLTGSSITCTISGMTAPQLLIVSASLSGLAFIMSGVQDKYNLKRRYEQHKMSIQQYSNLIREIIAVLSKNNLTSEEYHNYITEIYDKISLIEDSSLII